MSNQQRNGVQQPIFAPASQQGGHMLGDDIDLNEIFADYFINEFEDPLNAYTNSMANYNGAAAAMALAQKQQMVDMKMDHHQQQQQQHQQQQQQPLFSTLPTGGIKTAFHMASIASQTQQPQQQQQMMQQPQQQQMMQQQQQQHMMQQQQQQQMQTQQQQPQQQHMQMQQQQPNATVPAAKKMRADDPSHRGGGLVTAYHQSAIPVPHAGAPIIGRGGISGRLGFSLVGGQLAVPTQQQQRQQQQQAQVIPDPATFPVASGHPGQQPTEGIVLPVGVGIRLGGIGGVAPAMAQSGVSGTHFSMWNGPAGMQSGAGVMSEHAIAERRQRNREHAKRSRVRKKFMLESMQEQVRALQKENVELRMLIQEKIPAHAQTIISECCSKNTLFSDPADYDAEDTGGSKPTSLEKADFNLMESLTSGQQNFVLSDPRLPDNPIVFASPGFYVLTGYTQDQVLGRNCRFLQGPGTDPRAVDIIRKAIATGSDATCCILNYKADGTPFWNQFFVAALRDADNCIVNYVGVQCEVESEAVTSSLEDKVNSVLPLQNKEGDDDDDDDDSAVVAE